MPRTVDNTEFCLVSAWREGLWSESARTSTGFFKYSQPMSGGRLIVRRPRVSCWGHIHILQQDSSPTIWVEEAYSEFTLTNLILSGTYGWWFCSSLRNPLVWNHVVHRHVYRYLSLMLVCHQVSWCPIYQPILLSFILVLFYPLQASIHFHEFWTEEFYVFHVSHLFWFNSTRWLHSHYQTNWPVSRLVMLQSCSSGVKCYTLHSTERRLS
jgi:hypothetical protein